MIDIDKIEGVAKTAQGALGAYNAPDLYASPEIVLELVGLIRSQEVALKISHEKFDAEAARFKAMSDYAEQLKSELAAIPAQTGMPVTPKAIEEIKDLLLWPVTEDDARAARDMLQSIHFDISMADTVAISLVSHKTLLHATSAGYAAGKAEGHMLGFDVAMANRTAQPVQQPAPELFSEKLAREMREGTAVFVSPAPVAAPVAEKPLCYVSKSAVQQWLNGRPVQVSTSPVPSSIHTVAIYATPVPAACVKPDERKYTQADMERFAKECMAAREARTMQPDSGRDAALVDEADLECQIPPLGLRCTRGAGHSGPCAVVECPEDIEAVKRGMERLAAHPANVAQVGELSDTSADPVVESNVALMRKRSSIGIKQYGTTLADSGLPIRDLLVHALEESLDMANYIQAVIHQTDAMSAPTKTDKG